MAKAKAKKKETAVAKMEEEEVSATRFGDIFDGYSEEDLADLENTTGTEDAPPEERRPPLYAWNLDMTDDFGNSVHKNVFYNCQNGEMYDEVECALLGFKKTRERSSVDESSGEKTVHCRSLDRNTGMDAVTGNLIECNSCRHIHGEKGRRKDCVFVLRFVAWDLRKNEFFVINIKRSSYVPMNRYLERNFFGQYKNKKTGKRGDLPLFMLKTLLRLKEETGSGNRYYVIDPKAVEPLPKETVLDLLPQAEAVKKMTQTDFEKKFEGDGKDKAKKTEIVDDPDIPF